MSSVAAFNVLLGSGASLLAAAALLWTLRAIDAKLRVPFGQRRLLVAGYALSVAGVMAPLLAAMLPASIAVLPPAVQVWSGASMHAPVGAPAGVVVTAAAVPEVGAVPGFALLTVAILVGGSLLMFVRLLRELLRARRLVDAAILLRQRGQAALLVSDAADVPLSFWFPRRCVVVVPSHWLLRPADLRIALRHEAQHHRHLDTRLLYLLQAVRALFWWHPGAHWLVRQVLQLQELACDEAVAGSCAERREAYCRCLLRTAEGMLRPPPLAAAGILGRSPGALLSRVQAALHPPVARLSPGAAATVIASAIIALFALAGATASPIHDRRISLEDAERMATVARRDSTFPIVVNPAVVTELNALLGTPDGRAFLRQSLTRMRVHQAHIAGELARYELPRELLAVPLVESGYRNRVAGIGGGLWMFIVPTARRFGLHVSDVRDERTDVVLETNAAMRMLSSLKREFGEWPLALLAYNTGNAHVRELMREAGSSDAFALIARRESDAVYLPRVMAAVLVLANRHVLDGA